VRFGRGRSPLSAILIAALVLSRPRAGAAQQEQLSDPTFDPSIAHPAYATGTGPRVALDEAHHDFHTAGGRYKAFADLLARDGYRVAPNRVPFTSRALHAYDVLVIANALGAPDPGDTAAASDAFTLAERRAVAAWVRDGGALLLISDHHPAGAAAMRLAAELGVRMSDATVVDTAAGHHLDGYVETNLEFTRANGLLGRHPITTGRDSSERIERIVAFGGQSLKGPPGATCLLVLGAGAFEVRPPSREHLTPAGDCMALAFPFGRGRVVVTGEAAMLSAQLLSEPGPDGATTHPWGMNFPGLDNRQLALNVVRWLAGALR
jgi:hypothetical protein